MKTEIVKDIALNNGIFLHLLKSDRFKTNYLVINVLTNLNREEVTKNALIPLVLRRGSVNYPTMKDISIKLENMYGASFDATTDKIGNHTLMQFILDMISDDYTLENSNVLSEAVSLVSDIILNPLKENGAFKEEYVEQEKETLREIIESKINDKAEYAADRAVEEMYKDEPYGLYKYGYVEDIDKITSIDLYKQYEKIINEAQIHIYVSGNVELEEAKKLFKDNFSALNRSKQNNVEIKDTHVSKELGEVFDKQNVIQGKLVLGYKLDSKDLKKDFYKMTVYNAILGGTASSKLFNNVREKKSLAYTIRSQYVKHIGTLFVSAGIEIDNYNIAKESILKEIDDMKNGNITDVEMNDAKANLITRFKSYSDSQSALIGWSIGQKLLEVTEDIDETIQEIEKVTKEDVIDVASRLRIELSYFLTK